jgi:hypothetical protein
MLDRLRSDDFMPYMSQNFVLHTTLDALASTRMVELIAVSRSPYAEQAIGSRPSFSIIFLDPVGDVLPQSIYAIEHAALGRLEIFLVPIATGPDGTRYQAVFS